MAVRVALTGGVVPKIRKETPDELLITRLGWGYVYFQMFNLPTTSFTISLTSSSL
ncbi:hypothetical protein BAG01nite_39810 [Brevibacillus agri]|uniref:Uncharacterized protein n=1 Tax=Brevibacillus agri TaxID=51101 RepID=A0ABQ0SVC4_9BACL|nr:hypothetical protein BAG01nite_39810 [Brevibacillus agri]